MGLSCLKSLGRTESLKPSWTMVIEKESAGLSGKKMFAAQKFTWAGNFTSYKLVAFPNEWHFTLWPSASRSVTPKWLYKGLVLLRELTWYLCLQGVLGEDKVGWLIKRTQTEFLDLISGPAAASQQLCNWAYSSVSVDFRFLSKDFVLENLIHGQI